MIGFQTDRTYESWSGWPYIETVFVPRRSCEKSQEFTTENGLTDNWGWLALPV